ncbi:MAG: Ribosomal RNA small subunit methyltransferase I [Candidatus Curtissbacteria bacterium GW2011_GWA2_41_24]|nr:MAG: Ribosomal RNA small subunit methyltransferase I [Candidatus Curtissbacteria bacterium GW2011_GWA2_41_24]
MGKNIALVSDAGAPLIADPGYKLVREAIAAGIKIESISGPSAVISALTVSSKPPDRFLFLGYLPKKESKRKEILNRIALIIKNFKMTVVFYESPHRLLKTLRNLLEVFGDIDIVVCRELTKLHEEVRRERINSSIEHFSKVSPRGEFTIVL